MEPEKDPKGTTSRLKSAYEADLLPFEQHLTKNAPPDRSPSGTSRSICWRPQRRVPAAPPVGHQPR